MVNRDTNVTSSRITTQIFYALNLSKFSHFRGTTIALSTTSVSASARHPPQDERVIGTLLGSILPEDVLVGFDQKHMGRED
ncbi:hypothetical protein Bca4012_065792 [Brassica carinata]